MPCIIYRASYENELKGILCPLLGAFAGFSSAREKANEGKQGGPLFGAAHCWRQREEWEEEASQDWGSLTFYSISVLWSGFSLDL